MTSRLRERERERLAHFRKVRRAQNVDDFETWEEADVTNTLNTFDNGDVRAVDVVVGVLGDVAHTLTHEGHDASEDGTGRGTPIITVSNDSNPTVFEDMTGALKVGSSLGIPSDPAVAYDEFNGALAGVHHTLRAGTSQSTGVLASTVRRLTPTECERLQGFPDGWTAERWDFTKQAVVPQADSARYKQMGNAIAIPVFEWVIARLVAAAGEAA